MRAIVWAMVVLAASQVMAEGKSEWVYYDQNGRLAYKKLETGERIMDFSFAGYGGGGAGIPTVAVKKTVGPSGEDDTKAIQEA
ncbi:MAG TPA: hypothetical protein VGQ99_13305, partial [Tepidisphaeraceae bacterium]|nr:hypothetical protein [Tepidisphaeraceae bacterium]